MTLFPDQGILAGTAPDEDRGRAFFCTYQVTESDPGFRQARGVSYGIRLAVVPTEPGWRFRTRSLPQSDHPLTRVPNIRQPFVVLPHAVGGSPSDGSPQYVLRDVHRPLVFDPVSLELSYRHPGTDPLFESPTTFRYEARVNERAVDALCVDITYRDPPPRLEDPSDGLLSTVRVAVRDAAFWNGSEYRCAGPPPVSSRAALSNPVHEALGPVHARRALDVAHGAVRDRVRGWTPGAPRVLTAIAPQIGIGSLSGESGGFDYTGSSESVSIGTEIGSGSWQAGLVGSHTRTELHYRAAAGLAERGYRSGEHSTEILSLHPFAAWHMPSGGNVWTSLGAGTGRLSHRDDLGFPSRSRSDVRLRAYAAGASVPVADILAGDLEAEAGLEAFAFEIEGGGRISSALPTLRGRDWRAGLTWSAPVRGAPSLSVAYRHLTGDGPEGGQLETKGSVSVDGILDPRLSLISTVEGAFGLGDREHNSWGLSGGIRFAPGEDRRGVGLNLDTRLLSPDGGGSADVGLRGEAGYGMRGVPLFPTLRPFAGFTRYSGDGSLRRSVGIDLRDTPGSRVRVEAWDRPRDRLRAIRASLRHRF